MIDKHDRTPMVLKSNLKINNDFTSQADREIITFRNILVSIKLDDSNYVIWKHKIWKILKSLELEEYILYDRPQNLLTNDKKKPSLQSLEEIRQDAWLLTHVMHK